MTYCMQIMYILMVDYALISRRKATSTCTALNEKGTNETEIAQKHCTTL